MFNRYPYTNFHELNLDYFIQHFKEIFTEWEQLYNELQSWKTDTTAELAQWRAEVEADLDEREAALRAELEIWKQDTADDISDWETATLNALDAWKTAATAQFEAIRVQAAASAEAAAAAQTAAETARTQAQTAQNAAETAARSIYASAAQINQNTNDIAELNESLNLRGIPSGGAAGQSLRKRSETDFDTEWADIGLPTDEQTANAVSAWLNDHPDATTTVNDHSLNSDTKLVQGTQGYYSPEMFGFVGGDATSYVNQCVNAIKSNNGFSKTIRFKKGIYEVKNIDLFPGEFKIIIDKGATIVPTEDASYLFNISTTGSLLINGDGKIDLKYISQYGIIGHLHNDQYLTLDNIEFIRIKSYGLYINEFGGNLTINNCFVHDMQYQTISDDSASFVWIISGQAGYKGNFVFTNNRLIETSYKNEDYIHGPGGIFMSDIVDAENLIWGNDSSAVITNNVFDGLGSARQPVYSIHIYYQWDGIVIDSNVFRNYYECAIGVKDSNNVVISNNIFEDGQIGITSERENYAGAINYQPSDHTPGTEHSGLTIIGNFFKNAPKSSETTYAGFLTFWGRGLDGVIQDYANDIIVSDNKFVNGGQCIYGSGINNLIFSENICETDGVINLYYSKGDIIFTNNKTKTHNRTVLATNSDCPELRLNITSNNCIDTSDDSTAHRLFFIRSVESCVFTNNYVYSAQAQTSPASFGRYDASSQNIKRLSISGNILDGENKLITYFWAYIDAVEGDIFSAGSPVDTVKSAGGGRCRYFDNSNLKYYISRTATMWREITLTTPV